MKPILSLTHTQKHPLLTGTLILTAAGLITRLIGFFNRIYLSQLIGAKEMGIYQLIFPIYMIAFALCCHGIELTLSQMIAGFASAKETQSEIPFLVRTAMATALIISLFLSVCLYHFAENIGLYILKEESTIICLKLMAPMLPFTAIRCCLHGYYIGLKKTAIPSFGQLIEQLVRVFFIWLTAESYQNSMTFTANLAVCGMVVGEIAGTIYIYINYQLHREPLPQKRKAILFFPYGKELLRRVLPLTGSKLSLTLFSSLESILIPFMLTSYYNSRDIALSMYGVLTGMALPFILFPSTLTNSLSVMLLPTISEARAQKKNALIRQTIKKAVTLCLTLGFSALLFFFLFGKKLGSDLFHNPSAGDFLFILSFLCPFLYLSSSCTSILNGLGRLKTTFFISLTGILLRILAIVFLIPLLGIQGYLLGLLGAYGLIVLLQCIAIKGTAF